jgi:O-antigen/teichoic acid export membrane protein
LTNTPIEAYGCSDNRKPGRTLIKSLIAKISGTSIVQKAARTSALTILNFGSSQLIRLLSNLILTRLLYPEAFGIMALASLLITALSQFSDVGITTSIIRSDRGEERVFLNTAWTIKVIRGFVLFVVACGLSVPMALFYEQPIFMSLVPLMAIALVVDGFLPTTVDLATRHMQLGRLTALEVGSNVAGALLMIGFALALGSVWALAIGTFVGAFAKYVIFRSFLPGERDTFQLDSKSAKEMVTFGAWIMPSTVATFLTTQADKFLIGSYVSLQLLGIYNIGYFLGSFIPMLAQNLGLRVMVSFYKNSDRDADPHSLKKLKKLKRLLFGGLSFSLLFMVIIGDWVVGLLYDDRYSEAGAMLVLLASMQVLMIMQLPYNNALLSLGQSKHYFILNAIRATAMVSCLWLGLDLYGLVGGIVGQGLAFVLVYPASVFFAVRLKVWDPLYDAMHFVIAAIALVLVWWLHSDAISALIVY